MMGLHDTLQVPIESGREINRPRLRTHLFNTVRTLNMNS